MILEWVNQVGKAYGRSNLWVESIRPFSVDAWLRGLAHPLFLFLSLSILLISPLAALSRERERETG